MSNHSEEFLYLKMFFLGLPWLSYTAARDGYWPYVILWTVCYIAMVAILNDLGLVAFPIALIFCNVPLLWLTKREG